MKSSKTKSQWTRFLALTAKQRRALDVMTTAANKSSRHRRVCLAIDEYMSPAKQEFLLAFFSLDQVEDNGIEEPISFTDDQGAVFTFPYHQCRTWSVSRLPDPRAPELQTCKPA
jgi:hypothetical protein